MKAPRLARWAWLLLTLPLSLALAGSGLPDRSQRPQADGVPRIAIIIDDLGRSEALGRRAAGLPGPVACAFLPRAPHSPALAELAHGRGQVVMLHLPMQSMEQRRLDAGGLTLHMTRRQFEATLAEDLARVPHVQGVNNHMGSLLTRHPGHMLWLMEALRDRGGLFFIDSRTTLHTVARQLAFEQGIPSLSRDVFLDNSPDIEAINAQFDHLLALARRQGAAVAIGHPYPATLEVLEARLPRLRREGVELVPITRLVEQQYARDSAWRLSLSR